MDYNESLRDIIDEMLFTLVTSFVDEKVPFRLIITDEDNWDKPLPEEFTRSDSGLFALDIYGNSLEYSHYNLAEDVIVIVTGFGDVSYSKKIRPHDIQGIIDIESKSPILIKPFKSARPQYTSEKPTMLDVLSTIDPNDKDNFQNAVVSLTKIKEFNPHLFG